MFWSLPVIRNHSRQFAKLFRQVQPVQSLNCTKRLHTAQLNCDQKSSDSSPPGDIPVTYITKDGAEKVLVYGKDGDNLMHLAQRHSIDIEGACEASCACCTCHVYVEDEFYDRLPPPSEEEEDLLDMAPFLKPNSRLSKISILNLFSNLEISFFFSGCQIILNKEIANITVQLPPATVNFYVDNKKPSH